MGFGLRAESSFTDLRLVGGFHGEHVYVCGYAGVDDGSQGIFRWDSGSSATANGDSVVAVNGVTTGRWLRVSTERNLPNYLRNSGMWFAQRQAPGTATNYSSTTGRAFTADGWAVTNENASTSYQRVDTQGAPEAGLQGRFYGTFRKVTSTGKFEVSQCLEGSDTTALRGRTARLQLWMKGTAAQTVRLGLVQLTSAGTIDTISTFIPGTHGANGTDPTLGTNLSFITPKSSIAPDNGTTSGAAVNCLVNTNWQRFGAAFDVPTDCKNLIVMIWTNDQITATNGFSISQASLTDGVGIQDWSPLPYAQELARVQRFYAKTFGVDTAPTQGAGASSGSLRCVLGKAGATALAAQFQWRFPVALRAAPSTTTTTYNPVAANNSVRQIGGTAGDPTSTASSNWTETSVDVTATGVATGAIGDQCGVHVSVDAEL